MEMVMGSKTGWLVLSLIGLVVLIRCRYEPGPPVISKIEGNTHPQVRDTCRFVCLVEPGARGPLSYEWWCSGGTVEERLGNGVRWRAPDSSGQEIVKVRVIDGRGRDTSDSIVVSVLPRVVSFINWDGAVKAGEAVWFFDSCLAGYRLEGSSSSDTTSIFLIFMNEPNFRRWKNGEDYQWLIRRLAYRSGTFYDTIPESGVYFLVLDNTQGLCDCSYRVKIVLSSP